MRPGALLLLQVVGNGLWILSPVPRPPSPFGSYYQGPLFRVTAEFC